jgi:NADPH:quinone reductase-like Zn-dependent oxidoreductase
MSSWAALTERAKFVAGENVLINGATGVAGRLAIQIAKHLGAKKVIATGRNADVLKTLPAFGADAIIPLGQDGESLEKAFKDQFSSGIDVVLDYLWGPSAEHLLIAGAQAAKEAIPIRFVQIGSASSPNVTLPGAVLRSSALQLMGSGLGSVSIDRLAKAIGALLIAAAKHDFKVETQAIPLTQVETAWSMEGAERIVFAIG